MSDGRALVVVPTFNERDTIAEAVARLFAHGDGIDLLVVDDSSPDGTADVVRALAARHPVHLLTRPGKQGLGTAYIEGFRWAIARGYWAVVEMDADLSHDPADVPRLLEALRDADLAIGSRYVPGGRIENWSAVRRVLSRAGNLYARIWLGSAPGDWTSGFRAYRVAALDDPALSGVRSEGYAFQIEMTRRMRLAGRAIAEVPITFVERRAGASKMSSRIVVEAVVRVTAWGVRHRLRHVLRRRRGGPPGRTSSPGGE